WSAHHGSMIQIVRTTLLALSLLLRTAHAQVSACARCHAEIAVTFQKTGMGRSFYRMRPQLFPEKPYYHAPSDTYFAMIERATRAIAHECMSCHNAHPKIPAANREEGAEAKYLAPPPEGIDCQRCHGPSLQHVATSGKASIVNPRRLAPDRELDICMQCHLE